MLFSSKNLIALMVFICINVPMSPVFADKANPFVQFEGENLQFGRTVWVENCQGCHGYGIAGAPIPMEKDEWQHRIKKDVSVLYRHAIDGFFGEDDTMMPSRGGNPELSDKQVMAAVDYMLKLAKYYAAKE